MPRDHCHTRSSALPRCFFVLPLVAMDLPVVAVSYLKVVSGVVDFLPPGSLQSTWYS